MQYVGAGQCSAVPSLGPWGGRRGGGPSGRRALCWPDSRRQPAKEAPLPTPGRWATSSTTTALGPLQQQSGRPKPAEAVSSVPATTAASGRQAGRQAGRQQQSGPGPSQPRLHSPWLGGRALLRARRWSVETWCWATPSLPLPLVPLQQQPGRQEGVDRSPQACRGSEQRASGPSHQSSSQAA